MQQIINRVKYDTETAEQICYNENTPYKSDFTYNCQTLYKKKKGEFFLEIETYNNVYLKPITEEEAKDFIENYSDVETYENLFGKVEE